VAYLNITAKQRKKAFIYTTLSLASALALFPVFWMFSISFRRNMEIFRLPPDLLPPTWTTEAYEAILTNPDYLIVFRNSYFVAFSVTFVSLLFAILGGYSFSRLRVRGSRMMQLFIIGTQMVPPVSLIIPYFILAARMELYDTFFGLVMTYVAFVMPFATLMMISYFNTIPADMEEAAMVDGCSRLGAMVRVTVPMALPGMVATAVYSFLLAWKEYLFAVTLIQDPDKRLLPVSIAMLLGEHVYQWNVMMALSVLASLPLLVIFIFLQKYLVAGMTVGAVKQ
jgi:multiple sugar transport system permease protein